MSISNVVDCHQQGTLRSCRWEMRTENRSCEKRAGEKMDGEICGAVAVLENAGYLWGSWSQ